MVFCGDEEKARQKFRNYGFREHEIPALTTEPLAFAAFVERNAAIPVAPQAPQIIGNSGQDVYYRELDKYKGDINQFQKQYGHLIADDNPPMPMPQQYVVGPGAGQGGGGKVIKTN